MAMTVANTVTKHVMKLVGGGWVGWTGWFLVWRRRKHFRRLVAWFLIEAQVLRKLAGTHDHTHTHTPSPHTSVCLVQGGAHLIGGLHTNSSPSAERVAWYTPKFSRNPRTVAMIRNAGTAKRLSRSGGIE